MLNKLVRTFVLNVISLVTALSTTEAALIESNIICRAKQNDYSIEIQIEENLKAQIKYTLHEGKNKKDFFCSVLTIKNRNEAEGVVPKLIYGFQLEKCKPEMPLELKSEFIENPNLIVRLLKSGNGYSGLIQWLHKHQPNDCFIQRFDTSKFTKHKDKF